MRREGSALGAVTTIEPCLRSEYLPENAEPSELDAHVHKLLRLIGPCRAADVHRLNIFRFIAGVMRKALGAQAFMVGSGKYRRIILCALCVGTKMRVSRLSFNNNKGRSGRTSRTKRYACPPSSVADKRRRGFFVSTSCSAVYLHTERRVVQISREVEFLLLSRLHQPRSTLRDH